MLKRLTKMVVGCWRRVEQHVHLGATVSNPNDALLWYRDVGQHAFGDFSIAVVQANALLEDQSQIESGPTGTFVGVYDGHGGPEAARYINEHLFPNFQKIVAEEGVSPAALRKAILATEEGFLAHVSSCWTTRPQIAAVGSCCLAGVIRGNNLFVANLGDSRAVMGRLMKTNGEIRAFQLSTEHNASIEAVRQELKALHPDDSRIVVLKHGVWRVKGIIQVTKSIGDVYLKKPEFNREPLFPKFRLSEPFVKPVLSAEPSIDVFTLRPEDQFIIFASDGLWEHLTNEEAVEIVQSYPREGIARRLIKTALQHAARKREMRYADLRKIEKGIRRHFHDDITVIVIFLDYELISRGTNMTPISLRAGQDNVELGRS